MSAREVGTRVGEAIEFREHEHESATGDEHGRGVDDVLARRSVVDPVGGRVADGLAQRADEGLGRVPDRAPLLRKLPRVV